MIYKLIIALVLIKINAIGQLHTINKKFICGNYSEVGTTNKVNLVFKPNHTFCMTEFKANEELVRIDGRWQIENDTLYIRSTHGEWVSGLVRSDDKLYICNAGNSADPVYFIKDATINR